MMEVISAAAVVYWMKFWVNLSLLCLAGAVVLYLIGKEVNKGEDYTTSITFDE